MSNSNVGVLSDRPSFSLSTNRGDSNLATPGSSVLTTTPLDLAAQVPLRQSASSSSLAAEALPAPPSVGTNGLQAQYYEGHNFDTLKQTRIDRTVDFNWGSGSPDGAIASDHFSVRWTGQIQPRYSEAYTFYTTSDDGVRLWVNGQLLVDNWTDHSNTENSGAITLTAGQRYDIKLEYYEKGGEATANLLWSSFSQAKEVIPQSQLFSGMQIEPPMAAEVARTAYSFVDSIGVNTHIHYYDTAYGNYPLVKQRLQELGVRHIRDGGSDPTWIQRINDLASAGIRSTIVIDPNIGVGPNAAYDIKPPYYTAKQLVKDFLPTAVEAVEILNEFDISHYNGYSYKQVAVNSDNWPDYVRRFSRDTYTSIKSDPATQHIGVIGPSFVYGDSSIKVGDLKSWANYGNLHPYNYPSHPGDGNLQRDFATRSQPFGTLPMIATEAGYHTGIHSGRAVSETVQGKYMPRVFLENFNQGIHRTFSYELMDQWADYSNSEANFGLLRHDGSAKPAFTAQKNLIQLLSDAPTQFTPEALNYTLSGNTQNIHHTLLQKSDRDFYLVLWLEVPSTNQTVSQSVTLNLATPITQATTYLPNQSTTPTGQYTAPAQLTLEVPDAPLVVKLTPRT